MTGYVLYQIKSNESNSVLINHHLNQYFKETHKLLLNRGLILKYPTHDGKVYVCLIDKSISLDTLPKVINLKQDIQLERFDYQDNGFSSLGYHELKPEIDSDFFELVKKEFGVETRQIKIGQDNKLVVTVDSYQKNLIDYYMSKNRNGLDNQQIKKSELTYNYNGKNFSVKIHKGDLLDQRVDVIVNAANTDLILGGGVAGAILRKCGRRIEDECNEYKRKRGKKMSISEVMHTNAYNIHANKIIHACGPIWYDYQDKEFCYQLLKNTFQNVLKYAENRLNDVESIAIPLLSSGIYGVPKSLCCKAVYNAIEEYLNESNDSQRKLKLVNLVNIDDETNDELIKFFGEKISRIDDVNEPQVVKSTLNSIEIDKKIDENNHIKCVCCHEDARDFKIAKCGCKYCDQCFENIQQGSDCMNC